LKDALLLAERGERDFAAEGKKIFQHRESRGHKSVDKRMIGGGWRSGLLKLPFTPNLKTRRPSFIIQEEKKRPEAPGTGLVIGFFPNRTLFSSEIPMLRKARRRPLWAPTEVLAGRECGDLQTVA